MCRSTALVNDAEVGFAQKQACLLGFGVTSLNLPKPHLEYMGFCSVFIIVSKSLHRYELCTYS